MSLMQLIIDGSSIRMRDTPHQKDLACLGWGLIAHAPHHASEIFGATVVSQDLRSCHEHVAFIEACLYAHHRGFAPRETFIQTDDCLLAEAGTTLHEGNYHARKADRVLAHFHDLCTRLYTPEVESIALDYLRDARIEKILGHGRSGHFFVEHARADYLAKRAARNKIDAHNKAPIPYSEWLRSGLGIFDAKTRSLDIIRLPFVETPGLDSLFIGDEGPSLHSDLAPEGKTDSTQTGSDPLLGV